MDESAESTRYKQWIERGASARAASALTRAGCESIEDAKALGRDRFDRIANCGKKTLREIGEMIGGWGEGPEQVVQSSLADAVPERACARLAMRIVSALKQHGLLTTSGRPV